MDNEHKMFEPPYYAVIFTSRKNADNQDYDGMAKKMEILSAQQEGFLGIQSVRNTEGLGITVSYWKSLEDIKKWKRNEEHLTAQASGRESWYSGYEVRICKVERQYSFGSL